MAAALKIIEKINKAETEDKKGTQYYTILAYINQNAYFNDEVKAIFRGFLLQEIPVLIESLTADAADADKAMSLEILVDIAAAVMDESLLSLVKKSLAVDNNSVKFYAVRTLMRHGAEIDQAVIETAAKDEAVACLLYDELDAHGKSDLFPAELKNQEYLAKSEMIRWLLYPTELGELPAEIELIGTVKKAKELYYVYRFRADDHEFPEYNDWMIGWAGGYSEKISGCPRASETFSHFEKQADIKTSVLQYVKECLE